MPSSSTSPQTTVKTPPLFSHHVWGNRGPARMALTGFGLGTLFGLSLFVLLWARNSWSNYAFYFAALSLFHLWEFCYVAMFHPNELGFNSFLLNHSKAYTTAFLMANAEYLIERLFLLPTAWKANPVFTVLGGVMVAGGLAIRILAMYTAGSHFHHLVREEREENHKLVTFGIYQYFRHPSYFGWFWYSVGTQVLLCNPVCVVAYAYVSFLFFKDRIADEEENLIKFFGNDYVQYRNRTMVGIPFIH